MNTQDLERLAGWNERALSKVVAQFVRAHGRLPDFTEMAQMRPVATAPLPPDPTELFSRN